MIKKILISVFMFCLSASFAQSSDLIIQIENIEILKGKIMIAAFDNENNFNKKENPSFSDLLNVSNSSLKTTFKSIPQGTYAIALYHDENSDGKLNTTKLRIPTEGVGFSGQHATLYKKPKFNDCVIEIKSDTTISINIFYKKKKEDSNN